MKRGFPQTMKTRDYGGRTGEDEGAIGLVTPRTTASSLKGALIQFSHRPNLGKAHWPRMPVS